MPSVAYSINASGADRGAQQFERAIDRIVDGARRAAKSVEIMDRAMRGLGQTGGAAAGMARFGAQLNNLPAPARRGAAEVNALTLAMRNMSSAAALSFGPLSGLGSRFTAIGSLATRNSLLLGGMITAATGVGVALTASVRAAAAHEAAMLRVAKVTNSTNAELQHMSQDVLRLSSTLGIPAGELAKIEQGAAQLGVRGSQNLAAFAEQVAMLTRTSDLGAEAATQALARLMNITGEGAGSIAGMAAALTDLGNKSAASESQILSMALELGRGTAAFDVSSQQLLSLGAALSEVGEKSERSATAVSQVFIAITDAASGGDNLQEFADVLGVTTQRFQELAQKDIGAVFQQLLGVLAQQGSAAVGTLRELEIGSARNTKVLLSLAEVLDRYQRNLGLVAEQYRNPTAAADEFARMNDSVARQAEIAGVQLTNIATTLGGAFLPAINDSLQGLNAFLLLMQGIEPASGSAGEGVRELARQVIVVTGAIRLAYESLNSMGAVILDTFDPFNHLPFGDIDQKFQRIEASSGRLGAAMSDTLAQLRQLDGMSFAPKAADDAHVLASAVETLNGTMNASSVNDFTAAFPPLASSIDGVADSAIAAGEAVTKMGRAVSASLADLQAQVDLKTIEIEQGKAAAETQKIVNELQKDGGKVTDEQRARIAALVQQNEALDTRLKGVSRSHKEVEKSAKDATKAYEGLADGLDDVVRQLENELELHGLDDGQRAVVELTQKIEELRVKAVQGGADEAESRELANQKLQEAIPLQQQLTQAKQEEVRGDTLAGLREQVELRRIEAEHGEAAAEAQRIINDLKRQGFEVTDDYAAKIRAEVDALGEFERQSTVVADAFEDFIAGIAAGTQELNLDGIADAFKAAFAASVKEKLKFDDIFKGNLLDLVDFAGELFSGGGIDIGGLFNFDSASSDDSSGGSSGGWISKAGNWIKGLFGGSSGSSDGSGVEIIGQNADGSYIYSDGSEGYGQSRAGGSSSASGSSGGFSWGGALAGGAAGYGSGSYFGDMFISGTSLPPALRQVEDEALSQLRGINQVVATVVGAVLGGLLGGSGGSDSSGIGGGIVGTVVGLFTSLVGDTWADRIDRDALRNRGFGAFGGMGPVGFDSGSWDVVGATDPLASWVMWQLLGLPTLGTAYRRAGEGVIDASTTFGGEDGRGGLQARLGDWTRTEYARGEDVALERGLTREQVDAISGGAQSLFSQIFEDEKFPEDAGRLANEQGKIMAEFLSRGLAEGMDFTAMLAALRSFAQEAGITLQSSIEGLDQLFGQVKADAMEFGKLDVTSASAQAADEYASSLYGITQIFKADFPVGVNLASIALQTMEKDGVKAFDALDHTGKETLQNLTEDAELFQDVVAHLVEQGFTIDTEEFEQKLKAITASAQFLGENFGTFFQFDDVGVGIQAVMENLKQTIFSTYQEVASRQLFEGTDFASAFEPVFAALNRIDEFDLTTATGSQDFMGLLVPALAEGRANLEEYIPILQLMADNWKEIEKIIDEAMEPDVFEKAGIAAEAAFQNLGAVLNDSIAVGIAVLEDGGTWDQAVNAFKGTFGAGVTASFKEAVFNAILDQAFLTPLIATYQPAFAYVIAAGMIHGFDNPRVKEAFGILMGDLKSDAEELGLAVFEAHVNSEKITTEMERAFNDAADITVDWANGLEGTLTGAFDSAFDVLAAGGSRDEALAAWNEALGSNTEDAVLRGIVMALIQAAIIEPFIKQWAPIIQFWTAGALAKGINDPQVQDAAERLFGPDSPMMRGIAALGPIGIDFYGRVIGFEDEDGNPIDARGGLDLDGSQSGRGPRSPGGRRFPGAATGGMFGIGETFIVGEAGPELVMTGPGGVNVIPLSEQIANAMLGGGVMGYANGRRDFPTGDGRSFPTNPTSGGRDNGNPIHFPGRRDDFPNSTTRPLVPPPSGRRPGEEDATGGADTNYRVELEIQAQLEDFFRGGDFASFSEQFEQAVNESVAEGVMSALLESGPLAAAIQKFNAGLSQEIEKAWADGSLTDAEIESIKAKMATLGGPIADIVKTLGPEIEALFADLGIGDSVGSDLRAALGDAFREFAVSGDLDSAREAVREAFNQATIDGIVNGLLVEGPIADAVESASTGFSEAMREAMADDVISEDEAEKLRTLGAQLGTDLETAFAGLDPVITGLFDGMRDKAAAAMAQAGDLIGGALSGILSDPAKLNYEGFSQSLRESIYQNVAGGLIDAFVQSAVVQGALAPMLGAISTIFDQIGQKQLSVAEANGLIAEQMAAINGVLLDPAFKASIDTLISGIGNIGRTMNAFPPAARDVAQSAIDVSDAVTDAEKDVCAGACALKERTIDLGSTMLDSSGRTGDIQDIIFESVPKFAAGGLVTRPTLGLIGEAGPEMVIPLRALEDLAAEGLAQASRSMLTEDAGWLRWTTGGSDGASSDDIAGAIRSALAEERAESRRERAEERREERRERRREAAELHRAVENTTIHVEAKIGMHKLIDVFRQAKRDAKASGKPL